MLYCITLPSQPSDNHQSMISGLPPNGTIILDITGIDDINVDGVPSLGMTLLVQNDTITLTDENVVT